MSSLLKSAASAAAREGFIVGAGVSALADRASFLLAARRKSSSASPRVEAGVKRCAIDLALAVPWLPVLAVVPGSMLLVVLASALAPMTLPSTFTAARMRIQGTVQMRTEAAQTLEAHLRAAVARSGSFCRVDADALGEDALRPLGPKSLTATAALYNNNYNNGADVVGKNENAAVRARAAAAEFNDSISLDDAALRIQETLGEGPFATGADVEKAAADAAQACVVRGLRGLQATTKAPGPGDSANFLRAWLTLRLEYPPAPLFAALAASARGDRLKE